MMRVCSRIRALAGAFGVALLLSMLGVASAQAVQSRPLLGTFGPQGTGAGTFSSVQGVAVDHATGDVYVYDAAANGGTVYKFDAAGAPQDFSLNASNALEGVGGAGGGENEIAIDNSSGPDAGDIYVANNSEVGIYGSAGNLLGKLTGGEACGVAVGAQGDVYVGFWPSTVTKYVPVASPVVSTNAAGSLEGLNGVCNVAVNGAGDVYAATYSGGINVYEPSQFGLPAALGTLLDAEGSTLAIDPTSEEADIDEGADIAQFSSTGSLVAKSGAGMLSRSWGVAVGASDHVYASTNGHRVAIFGALTELAEASTEAASGASKTSLTFNGSVDPDNTTVSECKFEYGSEEGVYEHEVACTPAPPLTGASAIPVSAQLAGLPGGTVYHYRLAARNANGTAYGAEQTGSTLAAVDDLSTGSAEDATKHTAKLNGTLSPDGEDVHYYFEYGTGATYGSMSPALPGADAGSASEAVAVQTVLGGLLAETTYHYRLVGVDVSGTTYGEDETLTTLPQPTIDGESSEHVSSTGVTLRAQITPNEQQTTYRFEYGMSTAYGTSVPVPDGAVGSGNEPVLVTQLLQGLQPGTTYHYRLVVVNDEGEEIASGDRTFHTYASAIVAADSCPNAQIRAEQFSAYLPECRAYELVSPVEKNGGSVAADRSFTQSAPDGNAIKYSSVTGFAGVEGSQVRGYEYVAERGAEGWVTHGINPSQQSQIYSVNSSSSYSYLSPSLEKGVYFALSPVLAGHENVAKSTNLYLRNNVLSPAPGEYELLSEASSPQPPRPAGNSVIKEIAFSAASADMSHILFETTHDLTAQAEANTNPSLPKLYEWHDGTVTLAGILPNEEPAEGSMAGAGTGVEQEGMWTNNTISEDGSRVVFEGPPFSQVNGGAEIGAAFHGNLYLREDGKTVQLNVSERTDCNIERKKAEPSYNCTGAPESDPNGAQTAVYWGSTADDSKIFFSTPQALTDDASGVGSDGSAGNLYMYDVDAPAGKHLTLISVDTGPEDHGGGCGCGEPRGVAMLGMSSDGGYVYFLGATALLPGQPAVQSNGSALYVWHDGTVRYIASHDLVGYPPNGLEWGNESRYGGNSFRVSADGSVAAFTSADPGTLEALGFDNQGGPNSGCEDSGFAVSEPSEYFSFVCTEVLVYDYERDELSCASCDPSGIRTVGDADMTVGTADMDGYVLSEYSATMYDSRALSEDGRYLFFDTPDPLVAQDTNGRRDVYEYDTVTHEVHLITSGTCDCDAKFVDATPNASNVFFVTHQKLVDEDTDSAGDLYDARVDGGIQAQNELPPATCEGEDCQGPAAPNPVFSSPASSTFSGLGNPAVGGKATTKKDKRKHPKKRAKGKRCRRRAHGKRMVCRSKAGERHATKSNGRPQRRAGR